MRNQYALPDIEHKIIAPHKLKQQLAKLQRPLVFTNGCFDILHRGHVTYIAQAKSLGASLLLAVNTDLSVRLLGKGDDRPFNNQMDRMSVLAALAAIDLITWFDDETPLSLILEARPEILVKGGDWPIEQIVGAHEVIEWGGQVHSIPFIHKRSTTSMVRKIRNL